MKSLAALVISFVSTISVIAAQVPPATPAQTPAAAQQSAPVPSRGCLAVYDAGSHAFRNIMLGGLAGALVSKKQYKVADAVDYPAKIGQKFHGNDLQTLQQGGTRIVILDKKYSADELHKACR
jgi:hypothetical protein